MIVLELWLKNTIPGVILLGAIGSLLSVFIIKLMNPWFKILHKKIIEAHWNLHIKPLAKQNWILGGLSAQNDLSITSIYILYQIFTFTALINIATASLILIVYRLSITTSPYLSYWNLILLILFMTSTYRLLLKFWIFHMTYSAHITNKIVGNGSTKTNSDKNTDKDKAQQEDAPEVPPPNY